METGRLPWDGADITYSVLKDQGGRWMELAYTITPDEPASIASQVAAIERAEAELFGALQVDPRCALFKRFFSSDLQAHANEIDGYKERQPTDFFFSVVEQPPASGVKAALWGVCLSNITAKTRHGNVLCVETTSGVRHIFAEHLLDSGADEHADAERQTVAIFDRLREKLASVGATIEDSVLRTWIYAPHVDADYPGIVKARRDLFDSIRLTRETHYIASTGIQGGTGSRFARVCMDAYALTGVEKGAIRHVQALEHMSPTHLYGVTFERGTAMEIGQTRFLFISGTASIDRNGAIVHPDDVEKQADRTLENISALLASAGFTTRDLSGFIVYLRDAADYRFVKPHIDRYAPHVPAVYVRAAVCRPGWLVEIEATAARFKDQEPVTSS